MEGGIERPFGCLASSQPDDRSTSVPSSCHIESICSRNNGLPSAAVTMFESVSSGMPTLPTRAATIDSLSFCERGSRRRAT